MYIVVSLFNRPQQTGIHTICCWCGQGSKQMVCLRNSGTSQTGQTKSDSLSTSARSASGNSACLAPDTQVDDCVAQPLYVFWWYEDPMISSQNCTLQQTLVKRRDQCVHRECHCKIRWQACISFTCMSGVSMHTWLVIFLDRRTEVGRQRLH